ncbi:glycoside hydrolase family 43 protein [Cryobacterium algoricola]|uniref:Glycoside hydrolase family 43 protein n=1 Tax=Cryobacterium algoricola TaxID=1259183 RepID=A0ABY2IC20_9MICO|nr:glycoside hydrolase family 43 protein [Cryobacterium algoricola]TFB87144.1 glycoside hydrolase family 43 protein [Cryobacterium algoricola]
MTVFTNPVLPGMYPDPSVCRVGDTFYLANSSFEYFPGLPLHSSTDLVTWTPVGHAVDRPGQAALLDLAGVPDSGGLYAPTLRHHDGVFFLACTVVGGGADASFLLTATDPAGPWSDPVFLEGARGIDPTIFFHEGRAWWAGCRLAEPGAYPGQTEIWLRELDPIAERLLGQEYILWTGAVAGAVWAEGPHLYAHDGWIYLVAAEGGTERNHAVSVARSRSVTGPYVGNPANPILSHRQLGATATVQNVGHADLVEAGDGSWWALALGVRSRAGGHVLGRETFLAPVAWESGWPVFNPGAGRLGERGSTPFTSADAPTPAELHDTFPPGPLAAHWLGARGPVPGARTSAAGLHLESPAPAPQATAAAGSALTSAPQPVTGTPAAFLGYRLRHPDVRAGIRLMLPHPGVTAGLALRQSGDFGLRLELALAPAGWAATAIARADGVDTVLGRVPIGPVAADSQLGLTAELSAAGIDFAVTVAGETRVVALTDAALLTTERAGGFVGTLVGPFVSGEPGHPVTITAFDYAPLP